MRVQWHMGVLVNGAESTLACWSAFPKGPNQAEIIDKAKRRMTAQFAGAIERAIEPKYQRLTVDEAFELPGFEGDVREVWEASVVVNGCPLRSCFFGPPSPIQYRRSRRILAEGAVVSLFPYIEGILITGPRDYVVPKLGPARPSRHAWVEVTT